MEEQAIDLPPMPPYVYGRETSPHEKVFTADQMQAYARAAVLAERARAAKVLKKLHISRELFDETAAAIRKG